MMESEPCSWKYFITTEWIWLQLMQQLVVNYLSSFCDWFKLHFKIKFKLLKKLSFDDTPNNILKVYLAITSTMSYLDKVLNLDYEKQLYCFWKIC